MIQSIRHRGLLKLYRGDKSQINAALVVRLERSLAQLDAARSVDELRLPGNRLHALKGELQGFWSITVSANWRLIFRFKEGHALDVDLVDYH